MIPPVEVGPKAIVSKEANVKDKVAGISPSGPAEAGVADSNGQLAILVGKLSFSLSSIVPHLL